MSMKNAVENIRRLVNRKDLSDRNMLSMILRYIASAIDEKQTKTKWEDTLGGEDHRLD